MGDNTIPTNLPPTIPVGSPTPEEVEQLVTTEIASIDFSKILDDKSIEEIRESIGEEEVEVPLIDMPDFKIIVKIDPVRLTAILNIESTAEQAKNIQDIVKADQGNIKARTEERMRKIADTLKQMDETAKSALFNKIFGWLMVAVAVIAAVAMSVASCAVALGPVVGALIGLTFQILNETKVTDKILKAIADSIQDTFGCDKATAQMWATILWTVFEITASIAGGLGADKLASKLAEKSGSMFISAQDAFAKLAEKLGEQVGKIFPKLGANMSKVLIAVGVISALAAIAGQTWSTIENYSLGLTESEVTKFQALIKLLKDQMEANEEMLKELMDLLNSAPEELLALIASALDAARQIGENIGEGIV